MSLQVQILLVLSGHPGGRATHAAMNADLAILAGAGREWSERVRRMASNAPGLDIFTEGYVIRDAAGWQITDAGRKALRLMDKPEATPSAATVATAPATTRKLELAVVARGAPAAPTSPINVINIAQRRRVRTAPSRLIRS